MTVKVRMSRGTQRPVTRRGTCRRGLHDENVAEPRSSDRHRVVVIGSGFGGLFGTKALRRADVDVTMVAKTTHHLFQPLLYQVATGILSEGEIAPPTREVLASQHNARVLLGEVTDIDLEARTVTSEVLGRETVTPYDSLIVAAGAGQSYFGNDQFAEFAPGMKSIDDALELRGRIFGAFELAEISDDEEEIEPPAHLRGRRRRPDRRGDGRPDRRARAPHPQARLPARSTPAHARVILLDAAPQVLPPFGEKLGEKTKDALEKLGVEVQLGAMVTDVDERGIEVQDKDGTRRRIEAVTKIWAAGVQASPLGRTARRADRRAARPRRPDRRQPRPDAARPPRGVRGRRHDQPRPPARRRAGGDPGRRSTPPRRSRRRLSPASRRRSRSSTSTRAAWPRSPGSSAVALIGRFRLTGFVAWLMWLVVHLLYLTGFKNRVGALLHWAVSFLGRGRSRAHHDRAADLRPGGAAAASAAARPDLVSSPGDYEATRELLAGHPPAPSWRRRPPRRPGSPTSGERGVHHEEARRRRPLSRARHALRSARAPSIGTRR